MIPIAILTRSYRLFPTEPATIRRTKPGFRWHNLLPWRSAWEREWAGI